MVGIDTKNKNILDTKFICPVCSLILRDPVQYNVCGHRSCQSCVHPNQQQSINCPQCQTQTSTAQMMLDRGFNNEMQSLPITCILCDWTDILKNYQPHLDQCHPNPQCLHCHQHFISVDQFNQHTTSQCSMIPVNCFLKDFGCGQQIVRGELLTHYRSTQHQQAILCTINQLRSQIRDDRMRSMPMDTDLHSQATTTTPAVTDESCDVKQLSDLVQMMAQGTEILSEDAQRLETDLIDQQSRVQNLMENVLKVKLAIEEEKGFMGAMNHSVAILRQELFSMKEKIDDRETVSYDGTLTWKIANIREKMIDAESERQSSIYSRPFYSSPTGYKMRLRLYLNGDGNARRTHVSLFFVLMRGPNDAILKFPFEYKVTFCLYDQTPPQRHIIDSFRPDIKSSSFQRPRSEMNIASGIPKFCSLQILTEGDSPYVRNDAMFIKVMVDFRDLPKTLIPFIFNINPGIPVHIQHAMIIEEVERKSRRQISQESQVNNVLMKNN